MKITGICIILENEEINALKCLISSMSDLELKKYLPPEYVEIIGNLYDQLGDYFNGGGA
jgi:hypothetical protein